MKESKKERAKEGEGARNGTKSENNQNLELFCG